MSKREEIVARIIELLGPENDTPERYYTQDDSPLGRTRHLRVARSGGIRSFKLGRTVYMLREDVHGFIEAHEYTPERESEATPAPPKKPANPLQLIKGL